MIAGIPESRHFVLDRIADGVYVAIATDGGWAVCNAGIVDLGDRTLVVDTFVHTEPAEELRRAAERLTGRAVEYVFNTHAHRDHVRGNQAFAGARIVGTTGTRRLMAQGWQARGERIAKEGIEPMRREVEAELQAILSDPRQTPEDKLLWNGYLGGILDGLESLRICLPEITFDRSLTLHGSKRRAVAITFGGGHSESDALLHLPEDGILFFGDLLFIGYMPYVAEGDADEFLRTLKQAEALGARALVPGHGPVGTPAAFAAMHRYVHVLRAAVEELALAGGARSAAEVPVPAPFDTWRWQSFFKDNLESMVRKRGVVR